MHNYYSKGLVESSSDVLLRINRSSRNRTPTAVFTVLLGRLELRSEVSLVEKLNPRLLLLPWRVSVCILTGLLRAKIQRCAWTLQPSAIQQQAEWRRFALNGVNGFRRLVLDVPLCRGQEIRAWVEALVCLPEAYCYF